jgi:hypothetical protein
MNGASVEENPLCERGLAGINVRRDTDVAESRNVQFIFVQFVTYGCVVVHKILPGYSSPPV